MEYGTERGIKAEPHGGGGGDGGGLVYLDPHHCMEETVVADRRKRRKLTASGGGHGGRLSSSNTLDTSSNTGGGGGGTPSSSATSGGGGSSNGNNSFILNASGEEVKVKSSVQKLVDSALTPFLGKLEELFDPNSTTMQVARTSQHVITLWNADLLLTKLFDQNELTKYFTDYLNDIMKFCSYTQEQIATNVGTYYVDTLIHTSSLDEAYIKVGSTDSVVPEVETLTVGDMQIINYTQMEPKHIPKYVRLIALYKFRIIIGADGEEKSLKLENNSLNLTDGFNEMNDKSEEVTRMCIKHVSQDLNKRTINDLDTKLNTNYQEEMIMHIIVEQMESEKVLPMCIGVFLAKGCSFCRKRECRSEDLTVPIGPDNPVCPDRQCIKRNLVCNICSKQMANSKSLARHKYSVHDVQSGETAGLFICSHCGETFSKKWKLNVHEKQHEDRKLQVSCPICHKVMRGAIALKKHINMVHETKRQYMCDHCNKMFKRKETLLVHRRIHTGEKPFVCSHCDYSSETKGNLKAHTWRKHKRPLLATSIGNNGIETSITGPVSSVEELMESNNDNDNNNSSGSLHHHHHEGGYHHNNHHNHRHHHHNHHHTRGGDDDHSDVDTAADEDDEGDDDETTVLEGPVLELEEEEEEEREGEEGGQAGGTIVAHAHHLQETTFMMT